MQHTPSCTMSHSHNFFSDFVSLAISFPVKKKKSIYSPDLFIKHPPKLEQDPPPFTYQACHSNLQSMKSCWLFDLKQIHRVLLREEVKANPLSIQDGHTERAANPGWPFKPVGLAESRVNKVKWKVNGGNQITTKMK